MRFINTTTLKFHEVSDLELHKLKKGYSILSHRWTWGEDEIQYSDVLSTSDAVKAKGGFSKFAGACALAKTLGYDLIWIDTCCINKRDAVELSEAINSMYRWYSMSQLCIAYLQDVTGVTMVNKSVWFDRGWTLQELIAPRSVQFYNRSWTSLGSKASLSNTIVDKTGIPADVLKNTKPPRACSVAQRMSWAAKRTTQRLEDRAYSLMGLFDVNMPMIYGEREQAFIRLQEHIIAKSADESIFVWS
ncbi:HET-domain-containing protein, partial [Hypoxylon sp. EC38]